MLLTSKALIPLKLTLRSGGSKGPTCSFAYGALMLIWGEKIANDVTNKANIQTIHTAHTTFEEIRKWAEGLNRHFLKGRRTDGQYAMKMLHIANY